MQVFRPSKGRTGVAIAETGKLWENLGKRTRNLVLAMLTLRCQLDMHVEISCRQLDIQIWSSEEQSWLGTQICEMSAHKLRLFKTNKLHNNDYRLCRERNEAVDHGRAGQGKEEASISKGEKEQTMR
jgi:hypothetical protein